jgi:hypothetical protein
VGHAWYSVTEGFPTLSNTPPDGSGRDLGEFTLAPGATDERSAALSGSTGLREPWLYVRAITADFGKKYEVARLNTCGAAEVNRDPAGPVLQSPAPRPMPAR